MIVDTHCHFDMMPCPERYILQKERAGDIVIGMTNLPSHFQMGRPHVKQYKHIRLALGLHPLLAAERKNELPLFRQLVDQTSYIGEIGLDFSKDGITTKNEQITVVSEILSMLQGRKKIVSVHSRKAEKVLLSLLCDLDIKNVIFHWYSGPIELIPIILSQGYYFSINESMCCSQKGRAIIERIPRDRILTETDAPYNGRCDIKAVLAQINMTEKEVYNNFRSMIDGLSD